MTVTIAGVDGCPGGWVVATAELSADGASCHELAASKVDELDGHVAMVRSGELGALAIDMPIGLLDEHPRTADVEARRLLGPRRSSVFATPLDVTLDAIDYDDACARSRQACGKALSKQAWNLMPKIRQLDALVSAADSDRIVEAHPECAFMRLHRGEPMDDPKATLPGRDARRRALADAGFFDPDELGHLLTERPPATRIAPMVDMLDALALLSTARHVVCGTEHRLGDQVDHQGRRAEIVY